MVFGDQEVDQGADFGGWLAAGGVQRAEVIQGQLPVAEHRHQRAFQQAAPGQEGGVVDDAEALLRGLLQHQAVVGGERCRHAHRLLFVVTREVPLRAIGKVAEVQAAVLLQLLRRGRHAVPRNI